MSVSEIRLAFKLADRSRISRSLSSGRPLRAGPVGLIQGYEMHAPSPHPALLRSATLSIQGRVKREPVSRRVRTRVLLHEATKAPDPIPSDGRRRWYRHPSRSRPARQKIRKAKRRQTRNPTVRIADAAAPLISLPRTAYGEGGGGARSPVGVPPRRLRQRTNAAAQLQHALPGTRPTSGVTCSGPVPVQRASRRPVMVPAGRFPGAARERQ